MAAVSTPLLYVPGPHQGLARMLVCLAGLGYAQTVEGIGLSLAGLTNAQVTVLHVVEPVTFDYPTAREVQEHWQEILETDTPLARNLEKGLAAAKAAGLATSFKVRHGHAVREILAEVHEGHYDLIVMGSPHSAGGLRKLFTPNVTAEVAETAGLPVLTGRYGAGVAL
jgi:nucleotide-binding universal stress UspA family protein